MGNKVRKRSTKEKLIILLIGLLFFAAATYMVVRHTIDAKCYRETTAVIVEIDGFTDDDYYLYYDSYPQYFMSDYYLIDPNIEAPRNVYVCYEVDGVEYHNIKLNETDTTMHIGKTITIAYDANNPSRLLIKTSNLITFALIFYGIDAFLIVATVATSMSIKKK